MNKELHKEIVRRLKLRNKFIKDWSEGDRRANNTMTCTKLLKKAKSNYFSNLNTKCIIDTVAFLTNQITSKV